MQELARLVWCHGDAKRFLNILLLFRLVKDSTYVCCFAIFMTPAFYSLRFVACLHARLFLGCFRSDRYLLFHTPATHREAGRLFRPRLRDRTNALDAHLSYKVSMYLIAAMQPFVSVRSW